ncbi:MAG TPA: PaaI family thioesterase [Dehalococcoidia bacterium]|nr:PaaI family thioesterase [Dehalococcoidia bacterium]
MKSPLTNTFGFDSLRFVCDERNESGLRQRFFFDDESGTVQAEVTPDAGHSGAPSYAHGGFSMAILDDAMAWAVIAIEKKFGLSQHIEFDFQRPAKIGRTYQVEAWINESEERQVIARAEMRDAKGRVLLAVTGRYVVMTSEQTTQAIGADAAGSAASFTSGADSGEPPA